MAYALYTLILFVLYSSHGIADAMWAVGEAHKHV
jgi:hypothetical protein